MNNSNDQETNKTKASGDKIKKPRYLEYHKDCLLSTFRDLEEAEKAFRLLPSLRQVEFARPSTISFQTEIIDEICKPKRKIFDTKVADRRASPDTSDTEPPWSRRTITLAAPRQNWKELRKKELERVKNVYKVPKSALTAVATARIIDLAKPKRINIPRFKHRLVRKLKMTKLKPVKQPLRPEPKDAEFKRRMSYVLLPDFPYEGIKETEEQEPKPRPSLADIIDQDQLIPPQPISSEFTRRRSYVLLPDFPYEGLKEEEEKPRSRPSLADVIDYQELIPPAPTDSKFIRRASYVLLPDFPFDSVDVKSEDSKKESDSQLETKPSSADLIDQELIPPQPMDSSYEGTDVAKDKLSVSSTSEIKRESDNGKSYVEGELHGSDVEKEKYGSESDIKIETEHRASEVKSESEETKKEIKHKASDAKSESQDAEAEHQISDNESESADVKEREYSGSHVKSESEETKEEAEQSPSYIKSENSKQEATLRPSDIKSESEDAKEETERKPSDVKSGSENTKRENRESDTEETKDAESGHKMSDVKSEPEKNERESKDAESGHKMSDVKSEPEKNERESKDAESGHKMSDVKSEPEKNERESKDSDIQSKSKYGQIESSEGMLNTESEPSKEIENNKSLITDKQESVVESSSSNTKEENEQRMSDVKSESSNERRESDAESKSDDTKTANIESNDKSIIVAEDP